MTQGKKKSTFITQDSVPDDHFIDTFGAGVNRKIPKTKFFEQIRKNQQTFIYENEADLQAANLEADPDDPVYVRVAETGFWLYQITSLAATDLDLSLNNGTTATRIYEETAVIPLSDITSLSSLNTAALVGGQQFNMASWRPGVDYGGGALEWDSSIAKSSHNGGTVFSPTVPAPPGYTESEVSDYLEAVGETDSGGFGCFVRRRDGLQINELMFGALDNYATDMTAPIQKAIDVAGEDGVEFWGDHAVSRPIVFNTKARYQFAQGGRGSQSSGSRGIQSTYAGSDAAFTFDGAGTFDQGGEFKNGIFTRTDDSGPVFLIKDTRDTSWFNCAFYGGSDNIHFDSDLRGCWYNSFIGCKFVGSGTQNSNLGIRFESLTQTTLPNENWFFGCSFRFHGTSVEIINGDSQRFVACAFERAYFHGVISRSRHNSFEACRMEQNDLDDDVGTILEIHDIYNRVVSCQFSSSNPNIPQSRYLTGSVQPYLLLGAQNLAFANNQIGGETQFRNKDEDLQFEHRDGFLYSRNGSIFRKDLNDDPFMQQRNAADDGYVSMFRINSRDKLQLDPRLTVFTDEYADDAAAGAAGLLQHDVYRLADGTLKVKL